MAVSCVPGRVPSAPLQAIAAMASIVLCVAACGSSSPPAPQPSNAGASTAKDSGENAQPDAGPTTSERPRTKDAAEATHLINEAVDTRSKEIAICVAEARDRRKNANGEMAVEIGIDQEGVLLGVKEPKPARVDDVLNGCVRTALRGVSFPRSNAGVITVRKLYKNEAVYR